jgi:hypothetical protein
MKGAIVSPYEQAFNRIRAEFMEMPGMRLTPGQVERLSGVSSSVCRLVLDDLVRAGFLSLGAHGAYARSTGLERMAVGASATVSGRRSTVSRPVPIR